MYYKQLKDNNQIYEIDDEDNQFKKEINKDKFESTIDDIKNNRISDYINQNPFYIKIFLDDHLKMQNMNNKLVVSKLYSRLSRITVQNDTDPKSLLHYHKRTNFIQNGQRYNSIYQCCLCMKQRFCTAAIKELLSTTRFEDLVRIDSKQEELNVKTDEISLVDTIINIYRYRLQNEEEMVLTLLGTFNAEIKIRDIHDNKMGDGFNCTGENVVGKQLMYLRDQIMLKELPVKNIIVYES